MFHYIIGPGIREHEHFYLERRTFALFSKKKKRKKEERTATATAKRWNVRERLMRVFRKRSM